jgi:hypothetical protein
LITPCVTVYTTNFNNSFADRSLRTSARFASRVPLRHQNASSDQHALSRSIATVIAGVWIVAGRKHEPASRAESVNISVN